MGSFNSVFAPTVNMGVLNLRESKQNDSIFIIYIEHRNLLDHVENINYTFKYEHRKYHYLYQ